MSPQTPRVIHFQAPGFKRYETEEFAQTDRRRFVSISLTGDKCALKCEHCQGQILEGMVSVPANQGLFETCRRLAEKGALGVLVSGGSDRRGRVPHAAFASDLRRVKEELGLDILVHTGIVDQQMAATLAAARVDAALIDIIGAEETIREVYHLDACVDDFDRSLELLEEYGVPALPHIVMGLHFGRFLGEHRALEIVGSHEIAGLVLVALMPLVGTPMQEMKPPDTSEMIRFVREARMRLPGVPLVLGCARPGGEARSLLERAGIDAGVNAIAFPAEGTVAYARSLGIEARFHETCCGLPWLLGDTRQDVEGTSSAPAQFGLPAKERT